MDGVDEGTMLWGDGFEVETLINVRIAKAGLRVAEVPSCEHSRHFGASNLNAFSDGIRVLRTIHVERKRGTRRARKSHAPMPRDACESWSDLSTLAEAAGAFSQKQAEDASFCGSLAIGESTRGA